MPEPIRMTSPDKAPDPSDTYERSHPERESPAGKLTAHVPADGKQHDEPTDAVANKSDNRRSIASNERELPLAKKKRAITPP